MKLACIAQMFEGDRKEQYLENKGYKCILVDPKNLLGPYTDRKNSPIEAKKNDLIQVTKLSRIWINKYEFC